MLTKDLKNEIIKLRQLGKTYQEIRDITGAPKSSISNICKPLNLGVEIIQITPEIIEKAQSLYDECHNIKQVGKELSIYWERLSPYIKKYTKTITNSEAVLKRREKLKIMAIAYKGGECQCCHYKNYVGALEFHHVDPSQKDFGIGAKGYTRSWEITKQELDKCVLVCANCHREIHANLLECPSLIEGDEEKAQEAAKEFDLNYTKN